MVECAIHETACTETAVLECHSIMPCWRNEFQLRLHMRPLCQLIITLLPTHISCIVVHPLHETSCTKKPIPECPGMSFYLSSVYQSGLLLIADPALMPPVECALRYE